MMGEHSYPVREEHLHQPRDMCILRNGDCDHCSGNQACTNLGSLPLKMRVDKRYMREAAITSRQRRLRRINFSQFLPAPTAQASHARLANMRTGRPAALHINWDAISYLVRLPLWIVAQDRFAETLIQIGMQIISVSRHILLWRLFKS